MFRGKAGKGRPKLSSAQMDALLGGISDAIFVFGKSGTVIYLNPSAAALYGFSSPKEALKAAKGPSSKEWLDKFNLMDEEGRTIQPERRPHNLALRGVASPLGVFRVRPHPEGPERWLAAHSHPVHNRHGVAMAISMAQDITALREKDKALREQGHELSLIFENVNDLVGLMGVEGPDQYRVLAANQAYFALAQKPREEVIGKLLQEWLPPAGYPLWSSKVKEAIAARKTISFESKSFTIQPPIILEQRWSPVFAEDGTCTHIMVIARDVTELKNAQDRLRQAEKMEAMGQLAGGVAHDFNNLLTAINGYAQLTLAKKGLPPDLGEYANAILNAGEKAAALTSQLLAYSRKSVLVPRLISINTAIGDMEKILRRLIPENISLVCRNQSDLGMVRVDPGQLGQIILNLAVNARDAMPQGGELALETANVFLPGHSEGAPPDAAPGPYAVLSVRDTGLGMSPQVRERIFEPFFTTKEAGQGTGLGLSSVYGIVKQSGGHITVQSDPGKGSVFRIFLPMEEVAGPVEPEISQPAAAGGKETLLLAEDEEPVRSFIKKALELKHYHVLEARSGEEAVRLLAHHAGAIQLLITDMVMPGIGGVRLAAKARETRPGLKVLFITGYADHDAVRQALSQESAEFLQKPFSPSQLAARVRIALDAPARKGSPA